MKNMNTPEEIISELKQIGIPADCCERILQCYDGDMKGLKEYALYCIALFDDRRDYLA